MLIVPVGRTEGVLERHAWVTYSLVALNVAFFLLFCTGSTDRERGELIRSWRSTVSYLQDRPYLAIPPLAADLMPPQLRHREPRADAAIEEWRIWKEQKTADAMAAELRDLHGQVADVRMAYIPAIGAPQTILSSIFLHAGLIHLIGNMLFLLAVGPFVEDVYGRPLFLILYMSGGIAATLAFAARHPDLLVPLVGASGAIAAVMGAYLVRFAVSRLDFLLIPLLFIPTWHFRFSAPALVVLPIWFLEQIVSIPMESGSGVAVTAHVAGFAYGLAFAVVMRGTRIEQRFVQRSIAQQSSSTPDLADLRSSLDTALGREDAAAIDAASARLIAAYSEARQTQAARQLIVELQPLVSRHRLPQFLSRAAAFAERTGDRPLAISLYERLCESEAATATVIPSLVKLAALRRSRGDVGGAEEALSRALRHPECSPEWRRKISNTMEMMAAGA